MRLCDVSANERRVKDAARCDKFDNADGSGSWEAVLSLASLAEFRVWWFDGLWALEVLGGVAKRHIKSLPLSEPTLLPPSGPSMPLRPILARWWAP